MPTNRTLMSRGEVQQEEQRLNLDLHKEQGKRPPYASQDTSQKWNRTTTQSKPAGSRPESLCIEGMRQAEWRIKGSWVPSGKAHTGLQKRSKMALTSCKQWRTR
ncbi:hypothetical protein Tco_1193024 [Tanacetum coccineum]